jgi:hypothetical protein|tara:strand:- start:238 stop:429 length:192 start_codon:yes stop_codon:yes gene_type:complete
MSASNDRKIFLTEFTWDGLDYTGPNIVAETHEQAELICENLGCRVVGELTDVIVAEGRNETLH